MIRFKLTSPGVLLILAVLAAGGIFLLDLFCFQPHVDAQKWAALREVAAQTERAAQLSLRAEQQRLLQSSRAWAQDPLILHFIRDPSAGGSGGLLAKSVRLAEVDLAWISDSSGRLLGHWAARSDQPSPDGQADTAARIAAAVEALRRQTPVPETGLVRLGAEPVIFARAAVADDGESGGSAAVYLARRVDMRLLAKIGPAASGKLVLVSADKPPRGGMADPTAPREVWLGKADSLTVAWLARDATGTDLGYFLATVPVVHIHRQAVASRRMVLIILALSVGLALLVILGTHMLITGPVVRLLTRLQRLESGEGTPESLARDLHGEPLMLARRLESAFMKLAYISKTDELTGLANRRHFEEVLECFYHQARRYNRPLSLIVMDLDFFKAINDAGGHQAGDDILKAVSEVVEEVCRKADLPARLGGDEFAILLPETAARDAEAVAERIRRALANRNMTVKNLRLKITTSIGVADLNAGEMAGPSAMLGLADRALYAAKQFGRNRIVQAHDLHSASTGGAEKENGKIDVLSKKLAGLDTQFKDLFLQAIEEVMEILHERDPHMAYHTRKVQHYAALIAAEMELSQRVIQRIEIAAMMHDIGMLAMADAILLSPKSLDGDQMQIMRRHPLLSVRIMERMEFLEQEIPAVRYHHERFDGKGYPEGIAGAAIPLTARILAVADAFDAMTSPRTFRDAKTREEGLEEIRRGAGTQFDPTVVHAFLALAERLGDGLMDVPGLEKLPPIQPRPQQAAEPHPMSAAWRDSLPAPDTTPADPSARG